MVHPEPVETPNRSGFGKLSRNGISVINSGGLIIAGLISGLIASPLCANPIGTPAPSCIAGESPLNLQAYSGKVVLVDFWATWCPPCKQSMPFLNALRNQLSDKGFEIIAVNVDEDTDQAKAFLAEMPVDYPNLFDAAGHCPRDFEVKAMPSSYLIDRRGTLRAVHLGFREGDQTSLRQQIEALLAE